MDGEVPEDTLVRVVQSSSTGAVHVSRFTKDGQYCLTAGDDKTVRLYNPHKSQPGAGSKGMSSLNANAMQPMEERYVSCLS